MRGRRRWYDRPTGYFGWFDYFDKLSMKRLTANKNLIGAVS